MSGKCRSDHAIWGRTEAAEVRSRAGPFRNRSSPAESRLLAGKWGRTSPDAASIDRTSELGTDGGGIVPRSRGGSSSVVPGKHKAAPTRRRRGSHHRPMWPRKIEPLGKVYSTDRGQMRGEQEAQVVGGAEGEDDAGGASWRTDAGRSCLAAPSSPEPGEHVEAARTRRRGAVQSKQPEGRGDEAIREHGADDDSVEPVREPRFEPSHRGFEIGFRSFKVGFRGDSFVAMADGGRYGSRLAALEARSRRLQGRGRRSGCRRQRCSCGLSGMMEGWKRRNHCRGYYYPSIESATTRMARRGWTGP